MKNFKNVFSLSWSNYLALIKRGYTFRELLLKFIQIYIISRIYSFLFQPVRLRGKNVKVHYSAVIDGGNFIALLDDCYIQRGAWLSVPLFEMPPPEDRIYLTIGPESRIGPNCTISAMSKISIGKGVVFGPNVTLVDHYHEFQDIDMPISDQGITSKGTVTIEEQCWVGANAVIYSTSDMTIGKHSVIAANSLVRESVAPYTIVSGNPARPIKQYDFSLKKWVKI